MVTTIKGKAMDFSEVSTLLWREREALELLEYKLVAEQLILIAGQVQWLPHANREIEQVLAELRATEVLRALAVDALADDLALGTEPTLLQLSAVAPEPWGMVLSDHRQALVERMAAIEQVKNTNRAMLVSGARAVRETMLTSLDTLDTYDASGRATGGIRKSFLMDQQA